VVHKSLPHLLQVVQRFMSARVYAAKNSMSLTERLDLLRVNHFVSK